jgi:dihydroneopterin aldolase
MATIALEGMHFYAYHGFYEEERIVGNNYLLDIYINANTSFAARTDDLYETVNYETVYFICQSEMKKSSQLIETVAQRILNRIRLQFDEVMGVKIRLRKMNPPLNGQVDSVYVEINSGKV